jgi:hypothetical protein
MTDHPCCYYQCPEPGTIHVGKNGGDSHWICFYHFNLWHETRSRFIAQGVPCEMQELGDLLCKECWDEVKESSCVASHRVPTREPFFGR